MIKPNALVLNAPGINCNDETAFALVQAGADVEQVHTSQLKEGERKIEDYQILVIPGGFSEGDAIAAGRLLGGELRTRYAEDLDRFTKSGKAIIGICNGFQVLVETGLLPDGEVRSKGRAKRATLTTNTSGRFECRWASMRVEESTSSFITPEDLGETIVLPNAHMEGKFVNYRMDDFPPEQVPLRFMDVYGEVTEEYPANPNGSKGGVTAVSNVSGNILGMMPHPERFINQKQHPNWRRGEGARPFGAVIFKNIVNYAKEF